MKKIILLVSFVGASILTHGQIWFGPIVGVGIQGPKTYTFSNTNTSVSTDPNGNVIKKTVVGGSTSTPPVPTAGLSFKIGAQVKIDVMKYFAISTGLTYQLMSAKVAVASTLIKYEDKSSYNYFNLPIIFQAQYPVNKKITIGLGIGPEINYFVGGKLTRTTDKDTQKAKIKAKGSIDESAYNEETKANSDKDQNNNISYVRPLNIVLDFAPFVQFKLNRGMKLLITPTYYIGLSDIASDRKYSIVVPQGGGYTTTYNTDEKYGMKTGGFGLNVSLLFGEDKSGNKH